MQIKENIMKVLSEGFWFRIFNTSAYLYNRTCHIKDYEILKYFSIVRDNIIVFLNKAQHNWAHTYVTFGYGIRSRSYDHRKHILWSQFSTTLSHISAVTLEISPSILSLSSCNTLLACWYNPTIQSITT